MLVIRLSRTGRKKQPYYRVVVAEKSAPVKGRFIEILGHYNPRTKEVKIDVDRAKARVKAGAQPSETAEMLLEKSGVLKRDEITEQNRRPERKKRKEAKAEAEGGDAPKADAPAADAGSDEAKPDEAPADDKPAEEPKAEPESDEKAEEKTEEKTEEKPADDKAEKQLDDAPAEDAKPDAEAKDDQKGESA